jgi:exonuclease SbcC
LEWQTLLATDSPEMGVDRFAELLRSAEELDQKELEQLDALTRLANSFDVSRSESAALTKVSEDLIARIARTTDELKKVEILLAEASAALSTSQRGATQEQQRAVVLSRAVTAASQLSDAQDQLAACQVQFRQSDLTIEEIQARLSRLRRELETSVALRAERRAFAEAVRLARKRVQISTSLRNVGTEISRLVPLAAALNASDLRTSRQAQVTAAAKATDEVTRLSAELELYDQRLQALSEAVSTIAKHLSHDDTRCPVCATHFSPGRLLELANAEISNDGTPAVELATAIIEARTNADALTRAVGETDRKIVEYDQLVATLTEHRAREESLRQDLVDAGGAATGEYDDTETLRFQQELDSLDQKLLVSQSPEGLQTLAAEAEAALNAEGARRASLERDRKSASDAAAASRALLLQHPELWSGEHGLLVDRSKEQGEAQQRAAAIGAQLADAQRRVGEARNTRDSLQQIAASDAATLESTNAKLDEIVADREVMTRKWAQAGQSGEPNMARVVQYRTRLEERTTGVAPLRTEYARLVSGYRTWLGDQALRELERQISEILASQALTAESAVVEHLEKRVAGAQKSLELAQVARNRMEQIGRLMQDKAETFTGDVLAPLNVTIQRFARTLMTWSDASIIYRAEHHTTRSELRPRIIRKELDGSTTQLEMNPNLYFSEGQLSALSVSGLLAASTTFAWSRWRGLLLDDPLQHNDVIHASAFMDLLRQMVRELKYQVILSTHDSAEADFLMRKCRSAGIPYVVHELIPRGEDGLVTAVA